MSRVTIDLRQPEGDLSPLDYQPTESDQRLAQIAKDCLELARIEQNERDAKRPQG